MIVARKDKWVSHIFYAINALSSCVSHGISKPSQMSGSLPQIYLSVIVGMVHLTVDWELNGEDQEHVHVAALPEAESESLRHSRYRQRRLLVDPILWHCAE